MGCGPSNNDVVNAQVNSNAAFTPMLPSTQQQKRASNAPKTPSAVKNVLITCHTNQQNIAEQLQRGLINNKFTCYILTETTPQSIVARANLIRWCDVFIVLISRSYQQTFFCMETINYAKDVRKSIIAILTESNFQPYGALGAISATAIRSMILTNNAISENVITELSNVISTQTNKKNSKNVIDPEKIEYNNNNDDFIDGINQCTILICTVDDGSTVGKLVYDDFVTKNLNVGFENLSKADPKFSVRKCTVFVPILSPQFEQTSICRSTFEEVRRLRKPIVPVIAIKNWKSEDWLGLTIAGCTFFRISDKENAYKPFYDSNRMTDLRVEVEVACRPVPSQAEREQAEMKVLKAKIEECKSKLRTWPPPRKPRTMNSMADRQPVRVTLEEPNAKLRFAHIHHTITRMDMKAPPPMLDEYGLPKRRGIDCMISYQWDSQELVRKVYEDMSMREIDTWFDIWGSMQGNTNEAMATGVECAKVLLVFLSKAYIESSNCQMEFRYAVKRGKAFVIIRTEPNIQMEKWMLETIQGFPQYDVFSYSALETLINGVPTLFENDLRVEVEVACRPVPSQAEREQAEMKVLKAKIEECKSKLRTWPPPRKPRTMNSMADRQPVRVTLEEPNAKLRFAHIHHTITRMDMKAPPPMLDEYGLPKRRGIDCMISYQWDSQELVRKVYEDMSMREIDTWFDIWGSMQGNTNEAMATGVECAKVLLVFLSKAYIESSNCQMEFRYAVKRGKAFVIIRTEPNIQMEKWMLETIQGFPQYDVFSYSALETLINGVPTIDVIIQAVRKIAQAQPPDIVDDCSKELFELRCLLDDARDAISAETGQSRYKTCTRCNQQFDEYTKGGCKNHRAYYVGGNIIEGRWVCCRQQEKDSPGCDPCDHTDIVRVFTQDPSYGTWTWQPS
ncbi:unnamed protein product [Rotaria sordida]|uniref:TIR domain-containing protein n=1 Tax=Rotaria sordida TaxID=392033 RepID=A0A814SEM3_9BILA|nr:unnamed protein product [Rotaria sordida]